MQHAFAQDNTTATTQVASSPDAAPVGAPQPPGFMSMVTLFLPMLVVIYFFIIRPQNKRMKEQQNMIAKIKSGDEVVTTSGIFGVVTGVAEKFLTVEIAKDVKIKLLKSQVATINPTQN